MANLFIYLTPLLNLALFEMFFFRPHLFYLALILSNLLLLAATAVVSEKKIISREFWNFSIFPILFSMAIAAYSLFLINHYFIQLFFILNFFITLFYLKNIYQGERNDFLENISSYGNFLAVFFIFSAAYGLRAFLSVPVWILILATAVLVVLIVYQIFWANKILAPQNFIYIFIACLLIIQISWALYFFPFNHNILGLILAICYYMIIGLLKSSIVGKFTTRVLKLYIFFGFSGIILLLLAAKWA
jgi:hypothetical protein